MSGSYLAATALQAQHYLVSTLLNSTNSFSTLINFNTFAFSTPFIQLYSYSTSTYSTHLAHLIFNNFCIQHYLISILMDSTLLDFNNHGFNNPCFQQTWIQQSLFSTPLFSTILVFNNPSCDIFVNSCDLGFAE